MQQLVIRSNEDLTEGLKKQLLKLYNEFFPRSPPRQTRALNWIETTSKNRVRFILMENDTLVSHSAVLTKYIQHAGKKYKLAGLGGVFTRSEHRNQGYGAKIVKSATDFIKNQNFDVAVLFCHRKYERFYRRNGWEILSNDTILMVEEGTHLQPQDELTMIQYLSTRAIKNRELFEKEPIFFGESW